MPEANTILSAQVKSMLEHLRQYEAAQIALQLDESHRVAAEIRHSAHRRARQRMHERIRRERRRLEEAKRTAAARVATRRRLATHARVMRLMDAAWQLLPDALLERWKTPAARHQWCDMMLQQAVRALPGPEILIEHPRDWDKKECREFLATVRQEFGRQPVARVGDELSAGLRIHSGDARLDGSIQGLLARRGLVEAMLLARLGEAEDALADQLGGAEASDG